MNNVGASQEAISRILSDPTQLDNIGLSANLQEAALNAYSKPSHSPTYLCSSCFAAQGIRNIYYFMIPCAGIAFLVSVFFIKAHDLNRDDEKALKEQGKQWAEKHSRKHRHERKG